MNNIENNRMLAEFIKAETENGTCYMYNGLSYYLQEMQRDWGFIMAVVEKIEDLGNDVLITTNYIQIAFDEGEQFVVVEDIKNKIEAVYNACIEFVKWYNEQNPRA